LTGITAPSRSINSCLPACCIRKRVTLDEADKDRAGRRRSIAAERTQGRLSSCAFARLGLTARIGVPRRAERAAMIVAASCLAALDLDIADDEPERRACRSARSAAAARISCPAGSRLSTNTP